MALSTTEAKLFREMAAHINNLNGRVNELERYVKVMHDVMPGFIRNRMAHNPQVRDADRFNPRHIDSTPGATKWDVDATLPFEDVGDEYG